MSTHADPSKDEYLELEKKLGAAEYELAANLAETDKALDAAVKKGKQQAKAGRSDLTALPELGRARSLSHR